MKANLAVATRTGWGLQATIQPARVVSEECGAEKRRRRSTSTRACQPLSLSGCISPLPPRVAASCSFRAPRGGKGHELWHLTTTIRFAQQKDADTHNTSCCSARHVVAAALHTYHQARATLFIPHRLSCSASSKNTSATLLSRAETSSNGTPGSPCISR